MLMDKEKEETIRKYVIKEPVVEVRPGCDNM